MTNPTALQRLEGFLLLGAAIWMFAETGESWWLFGLLLLAQLGHFPTQLLQLGQLIRCGTRPYPGITLGLTNPVPQRLSRTADLGGD